MKTKIQKLFTSGIGVLSKKTSMLGCLLLFACMTGKIGAQPVTFTSLDAVYGYPRPIEWYTSSYGAGFGHKIYNDDYSSKTYLKIAGRHNSVGWQDLMTIASDGNTGIGTSSPSFRLHVSDDATNMVNNPQTANSPFIEPEYFASYHELLNTSKKGRHAALGGYDLNDVEIEGEEVLHGVGVFGKAKRIISGGYAFCIGVYGKAEGSTFFNIGGLFEGDAQDAIGLKNTTSGNENAAAKTGFGVWASTAGTYGTAGYFNGSAYSTANYQSSDGQLKTDIKSFG